MTFICTVCDNAEYEEIDGLYFCTLCNTQSEELITQEVEVDASLFESFQSGKFQRNEVKTFRQSKNTRRKDFGRPWTVYEGYQFIIMAQAEALINLGGNKDLKEIIFSLWAQYLSKLEVAFCRYEKVIPDIVKDTRYGRPREIRRGNLSNPLNRIKRHFISDEPMRKENSLKRKKPEPSDDESEPEFEELKEQRKPKNSTRDRDNIVFVDESTDHLIRKGKALVSPAWMNLSKTIAISFLGLQMTNPQIIPADVIRWVYEGKVPFLSTTHLLPPDLVLSGLDPSLFGPVAINSKALMKDVSKVKEFLGLTKMPKASLFLLIKRFLRDLDLPDKLIAVCIELTKRISFNVYDKKYSKLELGALLYIGFALKLLFGFDGQTEGKLSSYSIKVREKLKSGSNIFVLDEWRVHLIRKCSKEFDAILEVRNNLLASPHVKHPDKLLECYTNLHRDEMRFVWMEHYTPKEKKQGFRHCLRHPLSLAAAKQGRKTKEEISSSSESEIDRDGDRWRRSCLTHIADFSTFKETYSENLDTEDLKILQRDINDITGNFTYAEYTQEKDEEALFKSRPKIYLWLLKILAKIGDFPLLVMDKGMIRMQDQIKRNVSKGTENANLTFRF